MDKQKCDFCGAEFDWTPEQVRLDIQLKLMGGSVAGGLGACCDSCDDKIIAIELRSMAEADERERREEEEELWEENTHVG